MSCATTAVRSDDAWLLNGHKKWITSGWYANYFCVFARTDRTSFTMFVVPRTAAGVRVDRMACTGAIESGTASVRFDDVSIPLDNVIGAVGQGFAIAMDLLIEERWASGVTSLAMGRRALEESMQWANTRLIHDRPMHRLQAVRLRLARMKMLLDPMDTLAKQLAIRLSDGRNAQNMTTELAADCAGFKAVSTTALAECVQHAMILMGGRAFETSGQGHTVARLHSEVHGMACAGGTYDVLMDGVARAMLAAFRSSL
jgi:alkylation response protein AidB-like acyl-CoA dehydrogenase